MEAWTLGIWGMVNAIVILMSSISMSSAIGIAHSCILEISDKVVMIHIYLGIISNAWGVGGLFFGLWLFPMGYIIVKSRRMPVWLGRVLVLGCIGYLVSTIIRYMEINFRFNSFLVLPATIGEFWMIGYLLIFGIRPDHE